MNGHNHLEYLNPEPPDDRHSRDMEDDYLHCDDCGVTLDDSPGPSGLCPSCKASVQAEAWSDEQREKYYADLKASPLMQELRRIYGRRNA